MRPAQIAYGGPQGPTALTPVSVPADAGGFGDPVAGGGDIDGDGFMDLLVGSVGSPWNAAEPHAQPSQTIRPSGHLSRRTTVSNDSED